MLYRILIKIFCTANLLGQPRPCRDTYSCVGGEVFARRSIARSDIHVPTMFTLGVLNNTTSKSGLRLRRRPRRTAPQSSCCPFADQIQRRRGTRVSTHQFANSGKSANGSPLGSEAT